MEAIIAIISIIIGWGLNETSKMLSSRKEDRRLLNQSLYTLIKFRSHFTGIRQTLTALEKNDFGTESERLDVLHHLVSDLSVSNSLKNEFETACINVSKVSPELAVRMRTLISSVVYFEKTQNHTISIHNMPESLLRNGVYVIDTTITKCDKYIISLCTILGKGQLKKYTNILANRGTNTEAIDDISSQYKELGDKIRNGDSYASDTPKP